MPHIHESPLCDQGCNIVETQTHKYVECVSVVQAWSHLRTLLISLEPQLSSESNHDLLHLNFSLYPLENTILWLLGHYIEFIEDAVFIKKGRVSGPQLAGYIFANWQRDRLRAMPSISHIPGIDPDGIG